MPISQLDNIWVQQHYELLGSHLMYAHKWTHKQQENTHICTFTPIMETPDALTPVHSHYQRIPGARCDFCDWFGLTPLLEHICAHTRIWYVGSHAAHMCSNTQTRAEKWTEGIDTLSCITQPYKHTQRKDNERGERSEIELRYTGTRTPRSSVTLTLGKIQRDRKQRRREAETPSLCCARLSRSTFTTSTFSLF